jgi:hypothetical protein
MKIVTKISAEGQIRKNQINAYGKTIGHIGAEIRTLESTCQHELRELTDEEIADKEMTVSARCLCCGKEFGWRCKKSPDHVCHYYSVRNLTFTAFGPNVVSLVDGTMIDVPEGHKPENESTNHCIFCGFPEERK